jgi:hypothetical protein
MSRTHASLAVGILLLSWPAVRAEEKVDLAALLGREIIGPRQVMVEVQDYTERRIQFIRVPPKLEKVADWETAANGTRDGILEEVVYRGQAVTWRDAKTKVEWQDTIKGGPGYRIKKLRYEALPGLWIPALLYEPEKLSGKVPVILNVNGHDGNGKAAGYKQIRCINQAKRGMIALNVEWLGMGQLRAPGFNHACMNQIDLCGTSGLAPFYLSMKRGLDVLLAHENADPERVAVTGLSGGGWQTIFISALDTRVKLANPVAGYSSFRTRVRHLKDLGDSEQTPCDLASIADYRDLTAMMAPRPTLLTYNSKDNCCFESGYALPPLLDAAGPIFKLYGKEKNLRSHVNDDPGNHNYEKDNRQAFYRMVGDFFYPGSADYKAEEIACDDEVKTKDELAVELPAKNADFNALALALGKELPRNAGLPGSLANPAIRADAPKWQEETRKKLARIVHRWNDDLKATKAGGEVKGDVTATFWKLHWPLIVVSPELAPPPWTIPAVEFVRGQPKGTTIIIADSGRKSTAKQIEMLLAVGQRVLAVDPFYFGEAQVAEKDYLFALLIASIGERPLGIQASQVAATARWLKSQYKDQPVTLLAIGPRTSTIALVASALEVKAIDNLELHGALGSLKELIEQNQTVNKMPEMFCFGLLEAFDIKQLAGLTAPRHVRFIAPTDRAKTELAELEAWYKFLGVDFNPLRQP